MPFSLRRLRSVLGSKPEARRDDGRERTAAKPRTEAVRDTEQLIAEMRADAERERQRRQREESAREIREACERTGYWWPPSQRVKGIHE
jgi:hypothetical protein